MLASVTQTLGKFMDNLARPTQVPFAISDIPNFPIDEYTKLQSGYTEDENWYNGTALQETKERAGKAVEVYPVRVNPIPAGAQKHAFALFGEVEEDDKALVNTRVVVTDESQKEKAKKVEDTLAQVWWENSGRAIQWQNGGLSQVYGGCIFKASYDPFDPLRSIPIRIEIPHPKYFIGIPDSNDMFRLQEAWFIKPISERDARENGYVPDSALSTGEYWLIEHWTNSVYEVRVNEQLAKRFVDGQWIEISGPNEFGVVPAVYIPHIRINGFYGENFFDCVKGIIREMNLRIADYGDAVSVDSHIYLGMRNISGGHKIVKLAPGIYGIDLGGTPMITGQEAQPDIWDLMTARASDSMAKLFELLFDQYRRDAFIPKVADGEDEGSQRSGLTLAMRMLSLLWHVQIERYFWTAGLNLFNRIILRMLTIKEPAKSGITIEHATMRTKQEWSPMLPRDREMVVNEVVARVGASITSPETAFDLLADIADSELEKKRILEWKKKFAEATAVQQPDGNNRKKVSPGTPMGNPSSSE